MGGESQLGLRFKVAHPEGRTEQLLVDAERAWIGSGAHCEVRLAPELAAFEHVEVVVSDGIVHVAARAPRPMTTLDGAPITRATWSAGQVLAIGAVALRVEMVPLGVKGRRPSPLWLFALLPILGGAAAFAYTRRAPAEAPSVENGPPLFDAPAAGCVVQDKSEAAPLADEKLRLALAKRESGPFSIRDSIDAVPLFEAAAACYAAAGDADMQRESSDAARALRLKLDDEYEVRQVRLEHAYRSKDARGIQRELRVLFPMTSHRTGAYIEWLAALRRFADLEVERMIREKAL